MDSFDIYFLGETLPGADPETTRDGVGSLFKLQGAAVDRLFSGKPLRVKRAVDTDTASRYRAAFRDAGALVQIVPAGAAPPPARPANTLRAATPAQAPGAAAGASPAAAAAAALATGPNASDQASADDERAALAQTLTLTIVEETFSDDPVPTGTPGGMELAEPGAIIDHSRPAAAAQIDISHLEALPPNSGSLADCQVHKPARPLPDISHLQLVEDLD